MAIMPLPALLLLRLVFQLKRAKTPLPGIDSLLPQHSSIGGVGKGHSITGKDVDATHYASSEFKVEGLPDSPVFPPDSSVG
ncbi:hypothetical protein FNV43_RR08245 [Rhamnella rubrinervis]|uniref:Uncharacterized protein n=1 Tax=Rhamnella rubrinervis TaxID=2594499 RepID=A0A8K0HG52_9ROSA|nr:hypothetical protein FNV43_RR08245 [Rhamnella rubrinervis]